jgi:hypothetical protein
LSGDFERHVKRALEVKHHSLRRGSIRGKWRGVSFLGTLRIVSGRLWTGSISFLWRLHEGNMEGRLPY